MLLSSRAQPPRPLKDFTRLTGKSNLSVKQFLLHSPLPSPALPALVPRHGKKPPPFNSRRALRILAWLVLLVTAYTLLSSLLSWTRGSSVHRLSTLPYLTSSGKAYQIVADSELPDYPTPVGVVDKYGKKKWTISIPEKLGFPLKAADYADICSHVPEVANQISSKPMENTFLDVAEAQKQGLLPAARPETKSSTLPVCTRSLTYVLDATDAGLGSALMGVWISYALAKQDGRAFFLDDTQFGYGRWDSFFKQPPKPSCRPPPPSQRLPCPFQARHLVVSAATFPWALGADFRARHTTADIFRLARQGYEALFHLPSKDAADVSQRLAELRGDDASNPQKTVGIHLRRGDRHPFTLAYSQAYLPPTMYLDAASQLADTIASENGVEDPLEITTVLATDDPDMYTHPSSAMSHLPRAQARITLASKHTLPNSHASSVGWEGGFYPALFFSLGLPPEVEWQKRINSPLPSRMVAELGEEDRLERDYRIQPTQEAEKMRGLIGRAYLLDLAVLGGVGRDGGVVCAVSSMTCRLLAVMVGDQGEGKRMGDGRWMNIEKGYAWRTFDV
ncbi:uncharacterized protein AB675_644 [Cyphellophora attinorum]|uniref:Uncharacterized protein n=1 Tax=Cyphellophora attinorum TaxID=1664694 RepID=A0A0N1HBV0_9EURO|nr:uncharacterized protein AB675_644 [Phialophora attinorum]KPI45764.1 hypothetical protein AB675_644 [Phialophora attinorum]